MDPASRSRLLCASPRSRGWSKRREAPAAGRALEPDALRRQRDADRARRHLVSPGLADRPAGDGPAVLDDPAARARRRLRPGHAGREARHRGRGRAVRRGRDEGRGRGRDARARLPAQHRRPRHRRRRASAALRAGASDGPRPYLHVRGGLEALVARPVYYELAERALAGDDDPPGVWSDGAFFALEPAA